MEPVWLLWPHDDGGLWQMVTQRAERLPVTLNAREYLVDPEGYRRTTVPVLREQRDTSDEPGEQRLNTQMWVRSQTDWSLGAGQEFLDNADSDRRRFHSSSGVDPWTKGKAGLLAECESKNNAKVWTSGGVLKSFSDGTNTYTYVSVGTDLFYSQNFTAADGSVAWTTVSAHATPETITDFTSDGSTVFVAYGQSQAMASTGIGSTTAPVALGTLNPDWVKVVGGKLLAGDGTVLNELNSSGAAVGLTSTLPHAGATWLTACAGPVGIYAAANTDTGSVHFVPIASDDGLVDTAQLVAELPHGETINDMIAYGGFVILATSKGLRLAAVDSQSGGLTYGPVIDDGGAALCLAADDRFVWWGGSAGQVWRADLSRFTETLVPAYASDLLSVGDGNSLGNVSSVVRADSGTYFWDEGNGVQGPESTGVLVASATLDVGDVRWNSQIDKVLRTIETRSSPSLVAASNTLYDSSTTYDDADVLFNGEGVTVAGTIQVQITTDNGLSTELLSLTNLVEKVLDPALNSDRFNVVFTLSRDATTTTAGPFLESWTTQAFPSPTRIDEIIMPVVLKRRVATSRGMGAALTLRPQTEYDEFRSLMLASSVVTLKEGSRSESVVVDQLSMSAEKLSDDGDWWDGVLTVRLLTVPA